MEEVRTRFAPSPTGYLHIGGLRTALYAYLFAKKHNGKFILRIEDTDQGRLVEDSIEIIYRTMQNSGLVYDEGPDVGGAYGPYIQSERKQIYLEYAKRLVESGDAYYCFCTKERLEKMHADGATKYDKHCLKLERAEIERRIANGESYVIRQNIPEEGASVYTDMVFGEITVENKELEDNVLIKSDGMPTYNFANVVDDHLMGITHVIRGTEYLSSTPKYNLLYKALGWQIPQYMHLQPIMKDATRKLSKRYGDASYEDFIKKGYLPQAIINYIALLGWSPKSNQEKMSLAEMTQLFSVDGISKSGSVFDEEKMRWLNGLYVKELPPEEYLRMATPWLDQTSAKGLDYPFLCGLLQSRTEIFSQIPELVAFLDEWQNFDFKLFEHQKYKTNLESAKLALPTIIEVTKQNRNSELLFGELSAKASELNMKSGALFWIMRIALTGAMTTPGGATDMVKLLGKQESLRRMASVMEKLNEI